MQNIEHQFLEAMTAAGLQPERHSLISDGDLHRFHVSGDKSGSQNGWYVLHTDNIPAGAFGNWKNGVSHTWCSKRPDDMTTGEREQLRLQTERARAERDRQRKAAHDAAAADCEKIWSDAATAVKHAYLDKKQVQSFGLKIFNRNVLLVPMRNINGELRSLQQIYPDGRKQFWKDGEVSGLYHPIGKPNGLIIVCEGYATGASIHQATGHSVAIAFNTSNLKPVADALAGKYPGLEIIIAADDDRAVTQPVENPGVHYAKATGRRFVVPVFKNPVDALTDFNDLAVAEGLSAIAEQFAEFFARPKPNGQDHGAEFAEEEKPKRKTRKPNETKQPTAESLRPDVPTIKWISGKLPECVDQAELALIALPEPQLYQRDKMLVQVVRLQSTQPSSDIKRDPGALVIVPAADAQIRELFCRSANWLKYYKREDEWAPINCPKEIVETYKGRVGRWGIPPLSGIIEAPTLRDDGSILESPGYDPVSRLYFDPGVTKFPPIPQNPTKQDAEDALEILVDLYKDFPLVGNESHSVALSSVLTALIRKSLRTAPLHAFDAPVMASGKSLLARVCSLIATGRPPSTMNHVKDVDEERKRMLSVLMAGDPVICIDNISGPCNSDALCTVLTERTFDERILGASQMGKMPTGGTWLATGNNLQFAGDLTTRVVICRIDPAVEKPEERTFDRNLEEYIPRYRSEIVVAALTILRAYHVAGRPKQNINNFGRFEDWSNWVRSALVWLGQDDPVSTRQWIAESDPEKNLLTKLFTSWYEAFETVDGEPVLVTVKELASRSDVVVQKMTNPNEPKIEYQAYPELKDALEEISSDRYSDKLNTRRIGQWLKKYQNRIADGKKLSGQYDTHSKQWKWFIEICG